MPKNSATGGRKWRLAIVAFALGMFVILGVQMTVTATDDRAFCGSCHAMAVQAWTHKTSIHAKQACAECHLPYSVTAKLPYKAAIGINDVFVNTLGTVPDSIRASQTNKDVIQANCVRCHYATVQEVNMTVKPYCTDCHRSVPHMNKLPIDRRKAADA